MTRVVLYCDSEDDARLARVFLAEASSNHAVEWKARFDGDHHDGTDVYVIDSDFDGGKGLDVASSLSRSAPTILLAHIDATDFESRAFDAGVADILLRREITPANLDRAIRRARLRTRAPGNDADTPADVPLPVFRHRLSRSVARAKRGLDGVAVLRILPKLEPRLGTLALRAALARRVEACVTETDTFSLDGEGIWVLIEGFDTRLTAARTASRILAETQAPFNVGRTPVAISINIGGAVYSEDGESAEALLQSASTAARIGQKQGTGVRFPAAPSQRLIDRRLALEAALSQALARREFELHFQPQINLATERATGTEALLRWKSEAIGFISPAEFIPVLETTGGINEVGNWVMLEACRQAARWEQQGLSLKTSVNVSATQFKSTDVAAIALDALRQTGLSPHLLTLELTESVMLEATDTVLETLRAVRQHGIHVAVDDFGTGYASLRYIKHFPMDVLKIDREFVRGLPLSNENAAITNSIVALGRSLSLSVVAEGVETEAEAEFLRSLHCDTSQGYLHAKPMPAEAATEWLEKHR